jgi:hypothetical protein
MTPPPQQSSPTRPIEVPIELAPVVERMIIDFLRTPSIAQPRLDYRSAGETQRRFIHLPLVAGFFLFASLFTWLLLVVVPVFLEIYKIFGIRLPTAMASVLGVSHLLGYYGWTVVWTLVIAVPIAAARLQPANRTGARWNVTVLINVILIGLSLVLMYALVQLPLYTFIQTLRSNAGRQ